SLRMFTRETIGIGALHELAIGGWRRRRRRRLFRKSNRADDQQVCNDGEDEPDGLLRLHVSLLFPLSQAGIRPARPRTSRSGTAPIEHPLTDSQVRTDCTVFTATPLGHDSSVPRLASPDSVDGVR